MVTFIILVITTLVILSSVGIVSTQDELEHRLAIDCEDKGTYMIMNLVLKSVYIYRLCFRSHLW